MICIRPGCGNRRHYKELCTKHAKAAKTAGLRGRVNDPAMRQHLQTLRGLGWTWGGIANTADLSVSTVYNAARHDCCFAQTRNSIMRVPATPVRSRRGVGSGLGTLRRVRALAWMSWPVRELEHRVGLASKSLLAMAHTNQISHRIAIDVAVLYEQLSNTTGPSPHAAACARAWRYPPPMAWEGIDMDDPEARPAGALQGRRAA